MNEQTQINTFLNILMTAELYHFPQKGGMKITDEHGVYVVFNPDGIVSHVGNTTRGRGGLRQRLNDHLNRASSFTQRFLVPQGLSVRDGFSFKFIILPNSRQRMLLQALAIGTLCPQHIGTHEKSQKNRSD